MPNIISPHDKLFKAAMARPKVAKEFLQEHLPSHIKKLINLNTLKQEPPSFVDEKMRKREVDILYSVRFGHRQGYIFLLFEHLSNPDRLIALRVLEYITRVLRWYCDKTKAKVLPPVYPAIIYTGLKKYPYSTNFFDLFGDDKELAESILLRPFQLLDIKDVSDKELRKNMIFGLMVKAMLANTHDPVGLSEILMPYLRALKDDINFIRIVITYITYTKDISDKDKFFDKLTTYLPPKTGKIVMTIAEQLKREGKREGSRETAERIAMTLLHRHQSIDEVSEITKLPKKEVETLKRKVH